jgi:1,4-alpha-glucan branching enzyme
MKISLPQTHWAGAQVSPEGVSFRVWAPNAHTVSVTGDFNNWAEDQNLLVREEGGFWTGFVPHAKVGQHYKYIIHFDEQKLVRNDPAALQLTAAQDATVITDPEFDWEGDDFKLPPRNEQIIYELHIGTFNRKDPATPGTFESAAEKLDYLKDLGVNVLEVMPVNGTNMERWWGYEPTYLYAVESAYGGRKAFLEFVKAAHKRGIGVLVDVVYNHLSPAPGLDLWKFDGWSQDDMGGIYFYNDWRGDTSWGPRPDYGRPEVRQYLIDNALMWLRDCHVDGLRADAVFAIRNAKGWNNDPAHDIAEGWQLLQDMNSAVHGLKPEAIMIAEDVACNEWITKPEDDGGAGFDAQWETTFPNLLRTLTKPTRDEDRKLQPLGDAILKRYNGDSFQRVVFSESHDADANGQTRMNEEVSPGDPESIFAKRRASLAAAIALTTPGIPMLFQGQEFLQSGWFNHWDALDWAKAEKNNGFVQLHKDLIALRLNRSGKSEGLKGQSAEILHLDELSKVIAFSRSDENNQHNVFVAANFSNEAKIDYEIKFPADGNWKVLFNSDWKGYSEDFTNMPTPEVSAQDGKGKINLGPYSVIILSQDA